MFMIGYLQARLWGDRPDTLHRIKVGPYVFYFPLVEYFAGLFNEIFFKEEYYLDKTDKPIVVLDCGANIGISLLYIKLQAPNALVTCFEPNPAAHAVLTKNINANGWQHSVQVVTSALGNVKGSALLHVDKNLSTDSSGSLIAKTESTGATNSYTVPVDTLSTYITKPVDFLKIDIEGSEFDVLEEAVAQQALTHVSLIELEYHDNGTPKARPLSDLLGLLESQGFKTAIQTAIHPHYMVHGWRTNCLVYAWRDTTRTR